MGVFNWLSGVFVSRSLLEMLYLLNGLSSINFDVSTANRGEIGDCPAYATGVRSLE